MTPQLRAEDPIGFLVLVVVGAFAGGINSVAGGGSLVSFPTLTIPFGIPSVVANATNSVGLWPGSLSGAFGFLNLFHQTAKQLKLLIVPTLVGSTIGALLLVSTSQRTFDNLVPFLVLTATLILALQKKIKQWARTEHKRLPVWAGILLQTLVAIYGGYFGAGMGIMMLATMSLTVDANVHELNSMKNWLAAAINVACTILFIANGLVQWLPAIALVIGAFVGGYAAAKASQRFDPDRLRWAIVSYGAVMTLVFMREAFLKPH